MDPRWPYHNRGVVYGLQLAQIEIYSALGTSDTYNPTTNAWTATTDTLWKGKARIQPKGGANSTNVLNSSFDPTTSESILVQISFGRNEVTGVTAVPDLRPNDRMRVTASPVDDQLTKFLYVITNVLNSSNPWERSFMCRVDVEIDPTVI